MKWRTTDMSVSTDAPAPNRADVAGQSSTDASDVAGRAESIVDDPAKVVELQRLINKARELRPQLRDAQAETEERGTYSPEMHQEFWDHGFYQILQPKKFGGLELGTAAFSRVAIEVARGCLSTAWGLGQASAHNLTIGSYWPEEAQKEVYDWKGQALAPGSAQSRNLEVVDVPGGIRVSGTWQYSSGSPYSTHFMGHLGHWVTGSAAVRESGNEDRWFIANRDQYKVENDWGAVMGLKGSGSHSITFDNAFIPERLIIDGGWVQSYSGRTVGSELHENSIYAGAFQGLDEPTISAGAVGLGYAAIDEFERVINRSIIRGTNQTKATHPDFQRSLGMAVAWVDSAAAIALRTGKMYEEYARLNYEGIEPFSESKAFRLHQMGFSAERLVFKAIVQLMRTAGSSSVIDGTRLQRYYRDITTMTTRVDQFEFDALLSGKAYLAKH